MFYCLYHKDKDNNSIYQINAAGGKEPDTGARGSKIIIYFFVFIKICHIFVVINHVI
jgi:hypothetical protein